MDDREDRIRECAHRIWEEEGHPHGRDAAHWDMASEQIAIEENQRLITRPNPLAGDPDARGGQGEAIEPLIAVENQGEFPTMTDQGERETAPRRRGARAAGGTAAGTGTAAPAKAAKPASRAARSRKPKEA